MMDLTDEDKETILHIQSDFASLCNVLGKIRAAGVFIEVDQQKLQRVLDLSVWELSKLGEIFRLK